MPYLVLRRAAIACALSLLVFSGSAEAHGWHRHLVRHHHGRVVHRAVHGHWRDGNRIIDISRTVSGRSGFVKSAKNLQILYTGRSQHFWPHRVAEGWGGLTKPLRIETIPVVAYDLVREAERYNGAGNFTGFRGPWCKAGLNIWLRKAGYFANSSLAAISSLLLGRRLPGPAVGAIFVNRRGHHTGIVIGKTSRGVLTISANHGHRVGIGIERGIMAFIMPRRA